MCDATFTQVKGLADVVLDTYVYNGHGTTGRSLNSRAHMSLTTPASRRPMGRRASHHAAWAAHGRPRRLHPRHPPPLQRSRRHQKLVRRQELRGVSALTTIQHAAPARRVSPTSSFASATAACRPVAQVPCARRRTGTQPRRRVGRCASGACSRGVLSGAKGVTGV
jgi:hypothetical protein